MGKRHYTELDGIRGVAIALVMMIHYVSYEPWSLVDRVAVKVAGAGWMGVDLFFVLSGFLITGILFDTRESGRYLSTFFARRSLRIFPLYFAFVLGLVAVSYVIAPDLQESEEWRRSQVWYWTYTANLMVAAAGTWEVLTLDTGHLWSLAIEEQFYILWPFVVWRLRRERLMAICAGAFVGVFALRLGLHLAGVPPIAIFVATPTRIDALLTGGLAALLVRGPTPTPDLLRIARRAIAVGAAATAIAVAAQGDTHAYGIVMQTAGLSGIALVAAGLVVLAVKADPDARVNRALRSRPLVFLGTYSYAVYMLHQFAELVVHRVFPPLDGLPAVLGVMLPWVALRGLCSAAVAIGFALVSWHVLEKRFLALKPEYPKAGRSVGGVRRGTQEQAETRAEAEVGR